MATDNSAKSAQSKTNADNANVKTITAQILRLADAAGTLVNTAAGDTAVTNIGTEITALDAQADITFDAGNLIPNDFEIAFAAVEDAAPTLIVVQLTGAGAITDATGFTIAGSTLATAISSAAVVDDILTLTANGAVANAEVVTISYDAGTGNLVSADNAGDVASSKTNLAVTNNVAA